jgi:SAM-dependent methyltransferase
MTQAKDGGGQRDTAGTDHQAVMSDYERAIGTAYGHTDLSAQILAALREAGIDLDAVSVEDLGSFDELHDGERESTSELARLAELREGVRVLDVGSGLGGPARWIASQYGCRVTGLDLVEEFCRAATALTTLVGLQDRVAFVHGSALDLPVEDATFDVVWTQGVLMNLSDKARFFAETARVLRPGGRLAFQASMAGPVSGVHYPTLWADDAQVSHLVSPEQCRSLIVAAGFRECTWHDLTREAIAQSQNPRPVGELGAAVRALVAPTNMKERIANRLRNYTEGRVVQVMAV